MNIITYNDGNASIFSDSLIKSTPFNYDNMANAIYKIANVELVTRPCKQYNPTKIIHNENATVVFWDDGTKTVVNREKGTEDSVYYAFCAALAKKIFGTTSNVQKIIEEKDETLRKQREAEARNLAAKKSREQMKIKQDAKFRRAVRREEYKRRVNDYIARKEAEAKEPQE